MTKEEIVYASTLNTLGTAEAAQTPESVARTLHMQHEIAEASAAAEQLAKAHLDVLLTLAPAVGHVEAKRLTDALVEAARARHVRRALPEIPWMVDGTDCSPERVRWLEKRAER